MSNLRFALRQYSRRPLVAIVVVASVGLGIGLNTAIFSITDAVLFRPLPFPDAERIVHLAEAATAPGAKDYGPSYPDFEDWKRMNSSFDSMAVYHDASFNWTHDGSSLHLDGEMVSEDFFRVLNVAPGQGRDFLESGDHYGHVAIVSHAFWSSQLNQDGSVIGKMLALSGRPYTVIGVMPKGFTFPIGREPQSIWVLVDPREESGGERGSHHVAAIGRLKPEVQVAAAKADLDRIARTLAATYPATNAQHAAVQVVSEREFVVGRERTSLMLLFSASLAVLAVICLNVSLLVGSFANSRRKEIAIRAALGADQTNILQQFFIEALILAGVSALLGLAVRQLALVLFFKFAAPTPLKYFRAGVTGEGAALYSILIACCVTALIWLVPALQVIRQSFANSLGSVPAAISQPRGSRFFNDATIVLETGLGLAIVISASLVTRSLVRLSSVDLGFDPLGVLTFSIDFPDEYSAERKTEFYQVLFQNLSETKGIEAAAGVFPLPLKQGRAMVPFTVSDAIPRRDWPSADLRCITTEYFKVMHIPLLQGRVFNEQDNASAPRVAVVDQDFARMYFNNENPVGRSMRTAFDSASAPPMQIIGVVANAKQQDLSRAHAPELYVPYRQRHFGDLVIALRTSGESAAVSQVRTAISSIDRNIPVYNVQPMQQYVNAVLAQPRLRVVILLAFAILALLLAALGLYGVMSLAVIQRRKEFGVRMALGATREDVLKMICRQGMLLTGTGCVIGIAMAAAMQRLLQGVLFDIRPLDPLSLFASLATLMIAALCAVLVPATQSSRIDPAQVLRNE